MVVLVGAAGLGAVAVAIGGALSQHERITQMWVAAEVHDDNTSSIREVIDYNTGITPSAHGIFRRIPGLTVETPVRVTSPNAPATIAAKTPYFFDGGEAGVEVKIGDPNTTISGSYRYLINYESADLMAGRNLQWDAIGTGWELDIDQATVHVVAPWTFTNPLCQIGAVGSTEACAITQPEPGHLVAQVGSLSAGQGVTIRASRGVFLDEAPPGPSEAPAVPATPGGGILLPATAGLIAGLTGAAVASRLVRRAGRERVGAGGPADAAWAGGDGAASEERIDEAALAQLTTIEFAPPEGLSPSQGGVILTEQVLSEHKVAWLIAAAAAGSLDLVDEQGRTVALTRRAPGPPDEAAILNVAFEGRDTIELGGYDKSFATAWGLIGQQLTTWAVTSGIWDGQADRRKLHIWLWGGIAVLLGGLMATGGGYLVADSGRKWLPLVIVGALLAGGGFAAAWRGWELRVRTPLGSGLWLQVESFRNFLAQSETFHAEQAAERGVLREYTAWAVALGEIDRWSAAVAASATIPPEAGVRFALLAPDMNRSVSSTATAPTSSGGGFSGGGGGGVGGGGGGGGGGSW